MKIFVLTWGVCNSFFKLELECILPGGELDITNGYSWCPSIDLFIDGLSRELNPNDIGPEDLNNKIILFLKSIFGKQLYLNHTDAYGPCS